jgi:SAM-dependent methyltransferase
MSVLDVGCANGTITRSIAEAVAPDGYAVGLDMNIALIIEAANLHADVPNVSFVPGDAYALPYTDHFDLVTSARTLQWCRHPETALEQCKIAVKPGGTVIVLDYNHAKIQWKPAVPSSVKKFYAAYLRWRKDAGFDPTIADSLEGLMKSVGLEHIIVTPQHEDYVRGHADCQHNLDLWRIVLDKRGDHLVQVGYLRASAFREAIDDFDHWASHFAQEIVMYALAVEGTRPIA